MVFGAIGECLAEPLLLNFCEAGLEAYLEFMRALAAALPDDLKTRPYLVVPNRVPYSRTIYGSKEVLRCFRICF